MAECNSSSGSGEGRRVLLYACSGKARVAEIADQAARRLAQGGSGEMACLSAVAAGLEEAVQAARTAELNLVIDGCDSSCGRTILDRSGARNCVQIKVTDLDIVESEHGPATRREVAVVVRKVKDKLA